MSCVLTLALDEECQRLFEDLRQAHFPPERNQIPAHVTLFHTLPEQDETFALLETTAREQARFSVGVQAVRSIGHGVAYFLQSATANALHRHLSTLFAAHLSNQDRQPFRPHVVVQNKVSPQTAKETLGVLQAQFQPRICEAVGLDLWRYLNGPWQHLRRFAFTS